MNPKLLYDSLGVVDNFGLASTSVIMLGDDLRLMSHCGIARLYNDPHESPFCDKPGDELRRSCAALLTALLLDRRRSRLRLIKGLIMLKDIYKPTKFTEQVKRRKYNTFEFTGPVRYCIPLEEIIYSLRLNSLDL